MANNPRRAETPKKGIVVSDHAQTSQPSPPPRRVVTTGRCVAALPRSSFDCCVLAKLLVYDMPFVACISDWADRLGCAYQQGVSRHHRHPWTQCLQGPQRRASGAGGTGCPIDAAPQSAQSAWHLYSIDTSQIRWCVYHVCIMFIKQMLCSKADCAQQMQDF